MPAIAYKKTQTTDEAWDAGANEKKVGENVSDLRALYAWVDGNGDPETKSAYKFPHHMVNDDGSVGAANVKACSSGIGNLNGGRGGASIPEGDKAGVHAHLAHHIEDSGAEAPELKKARSLWKRRNGDGDGDADGDNDGDETEPGNSGGMAHPHDSATHEHIHEMLGGTLIHEHEHSHDNGGSGHDGDDHEHNSGPEVGGQVGVFDNAVYNSKRPAPSRVSFPITPRASSDRQVRTVASQVERRTKSNGKSMVAGYAAVFNQVTEIDDWFGRFMEKCGIGCFSKTLGDGADVRALFNHDPNFVLGRTKSGTLRLMTDDHGLEYEADIPATQWAKDLCETIDRGDIDGSSFGFRVIRDKWGTIVDPNPDQDSEPGAGDGIAVLDIRTLLEVQLFDVSPVTFPAYPQTEAGLRSLVLADGINYDDFVRVSARLLRGQDVRGSHDLEVARYLRAKFTPTKGNQGAPVRTGHPPTRVPPRPKAPTRTGHVETDGSNRALLDKFNSWL